MSRFAIQQIRANNTLYPGVAGYQSDPGRDVISEGSDGTVYETAHYVPRLRPSAELRTFALKSIIAALNGSLDLPLLALDGSNGLVMYGAKAESSAPGFASGSVHHARTALRGLLYLAGVRWTPGQRAEAILRAMFFSSNGSAASVVDTTVALPTQPTPDFGFALTALTLAATALTRINSFELAIDPKFEWDYSAGLIEPVAIYGAGANGKLAATIRADVGHIDAGAGTGAISAVFTKYAHGGGFGADTVTFTLNGGWTTDEGQGGDNGSPQSRQLLARSRHDGTNRPLTWATA